MLNISKLIPLPGYRIIKTGLSVLICVLLYSYYKMDGVILATTAALMCMQDTVSKSITTGIHRVFGTMVGGMIAILFLSIATNPNIFVLSFSTAIIIILIIHFFYVINQNNSTIIACFVYLVIVFDTNLSSPVLYSLSRIFDTTVGIVIAVIINHFLFRPEQDRIKSKNQNKNIFNYRIRRAEVKNKSKWQGSIVDELYIFPKKSRLSDRNFKCRVSVSYVTFYQSQFLKLKGFSRYLFILDGNIKLVQNQNNIILKKNDDLLFDCNIATQCFGFCTEYTMILSDDYCAFSENFYTNCEYAINNHDNIIYETKTIYSLCDNVNLNLIISDFSNFNIILNKGDFVVLENIDSIDYSSKIYVTCSTNIDTICCVSSNIKKK